jgi:hypothetical protein
VLTLVLEHARHCPEDRVVRQGFGGQDHQERKEVKQKQ